MPDLALSTVKKHEQVKTAFEAADWYLNHWRYNISIRSETIDQYLRGRSFQNILDIGCGDGSLSVHFLNPENRLTLVDLSSTMLAIAQQLVPAPLRERVTTVNADFLEADLEEGTFDLILCVGVLAHVNSPAEVMRKISRLIRPGGSVILEYSNSRHFLTSSLKPYEALLRFFRRATYAVNDISSGEVSQMCSTSHLALLSSFRYSVAVPGMHRLFSQRGIYKIIRSVFGHYPQDRNSWLGSEHILHLQRK